MQIEPREALGDTPAVLIHGPRQSDKTTLARLVGEPRGYRYVSFDDEAVQGAARRDPIGFVEGLPPRTILDEVQRVCRSSPRSRLPSTTAGRFILTGSANVLLVPKLADSLAGRMGILRLHPLAQCEILGKRSASSRRCFTAAVKAAKLHMGDTGLACALLGIDAVALHRDRDRLGPVWSFSLGYLVAPLRSA